MKPVNTKSSKLISDNLANQVRKSLKYTFDKIIPLLICTFGAAVQCTTLITMYFSFPTTNIIEIYRPEMISLPAITLCYYYSIDREQLTSKLGKNYDQQSSVNDLRYQLTVEEINQVTPDLKEFLISCKLTNNSGLNGYHGTIDCEDVAPITINLNVIGKCFTFFSNLNRSYSYRRNDFYDHYFLSFNLNLNVSQYKFLELYVHENDEEVTYTSGSPWQTSLDCYKSNLFVLTYEATRSLNLGYPYSNCINYDKVKGISRRDLIKRCMSEAILTENSALDASTFVPVPNNIANATFSRNIILRKYRSYCEDKYEKPECFTMIFKINQYGSFYNSKLNNQVNINFAYPLGFQSNVTTTEKLNFIEYFCYVASVVSLWLEISLLSVANFLFTHSRKIVLKCVKSQVKGQKKAKVIKKRENTVNMIFVESRLRPTPFYNNDPSRVDFCDHIPYNYSDYNRFNRLLYNHHKQY